MPKIDPKLYEFATVRQLELLEAIDKHGSYRRAVTAMTYHDVHGEAARNTVTPEMLEHHEVS